MTSIGLSFRSTAQRADDGIQDPGLSDVYSEASTRLDTLQRDRNAPGELLASRALWQAPAADNTVVRELAATQEGATADGSCAGDPAFGKGQIEVASQHYCARGEHVPELYRVRVFAPLA